MVIRRVRGDAGFELVCVCEADGCGRHFTVDDGFELNTALCDEHYAEMLQTEEKENGEQPVGA